MTRERIHSFTGVFPLATYLLLHVYETSSAAAGRRAFIDGLVDRVLVLEVLFVFAPLALHALVGLSLWARPAAPPTTGPAAASPLSPPFRTIQRVSGVVVLVFLGAHLGHTFALSAAGLGPGALYDRLRVDLGTPLYLGVYVAGVAAVSLHLAVGLPAALRRFGLAATDGAFLRARLASAAVALVVFAAAINSLSRFAVGVAFFGADPGGAP